MNEAEIHAQIELVLDGTARLPELPFRDLTGFARFCDFDYVLDKPLVLTVDALVAAASDEFVDVIVLDAPELFAEEHTRPTVCRVRGSNPGADVLEFLLAMPGGDPFAQLATVGDTLAVVGSAGRWALWGERDWELGVFVVPEAHGAWDDVGIPLVDKSQDFLSHWPRKPDDELREQIRSQAAIIEPRTTLGSLTGA